RLRVEGQTAPEIARRMALAVGVRPAGVQVHVAEFHSQHVYLFGPGIGVQRAVAYQGPETVLDLLQRTGGITAGAAPHHVYVAPPRVVGARPPEVFPINLRAILLNQDQHTNLRLQPFDQVFIGETRRASLQKCMPPCFRPLYEAVCGLRPSVNPHPASSRPQSTDSISPGAPRPGPARMATGQQEQEP